jgi:hypothetical protein
MNHIRISRSVTVPASSVFFSPQPGMYLVLVPNFDNRFLDGKWLGPCPPLSGEIAEAVDAFLGGTMKFPVNENGVLDLWSGWKAAEAARTLGGRERERAMPPAPSDTFFLGSAPLPPLSASNKQITDFGVPDSDLGVPKPDYSKIERNTR